MHDSFSRGQVDPDLGLALSRAKSMLYPDIDHVGANSLGWELVNPATSLDSLKDHAYHNSSDAQLVGGAAVIECW